MHFIDAPVKPFILFKGTTRFLVVDVPETGPALGVLDESSA